jgi:hypothetical protein
MSAYWGKADIRRRLQIFNSSAERSPLVIEDHFHNQFLQAIDLYQFADGAVSNFRTAD